jgi:hypothetical protein
MIQEVKPEDISININEGTATWNIQSNGQVGGLYTGQFTFNLMLSPIQEIEADRDYRELLGKNAELASTHIESLAHVLSQLKQRVKNAPPFWYSSVSRFPGSHIKDRDILELVYQAAAEAEIKYRESLKERKESLLKRLKKQVEKEVEEDSIEKELNEAD